MREAWLSSVSSLGWLLLDARRIEFWTNKVLGNKERDNKNCKRLEKLGWRVIVVWECELTTTERLEKIYTGLSGMKAPAHQGLVAD